MLVDDDGKPINKVDSDPVNLNYDSDVEVAYDETAQFMASGGVNDTSLYKDADYDIYETYDIEDPISIHNVIKMSNTNNSMQTQTSNSLHNAIMEAGGKDRLPMLAPGNYVQWKSRIKRYIDTKPNHELIHYYLKNPPNKYQWADKDVPVTEDNDIYSTVNACPNACEMWKAIERLKQARKCQKPKRAKDAAYHKEKMLLCKQEEAVFQLNAEQADWRDDTDDEPDDKELEAHYMYMAKLQKVTPDDVDNSGPIFDVEPLQKVPNTDNYNVFAIESKHPEQSKFVLDTYPIKQDEHNVIINSLDMSHDREHVDQDDANDLANERDLIASLIDKLKCEIDDSKNRNEFLETSNKALVDKLKEEMVADLRYFNYLELEVDSLKYQLETQKTQFLNKIDRLSREYYYADHMNAILGMYTELDEIVMDNPNSPNELNEDIPKENPVIPEPNHVEDAHDPNEMVDIPDDEDLVDYDGDDEDLEEQLEQEIRHGNQFAQHPNPQPDNMNVIEDLSTRLGNLEYRHKVLMRKIEEVSDADVADSIAIEKIHPRVATVGELVQVESEVDTYSSSQMAVPRQDKIVGLSQQVESRVDTYSSGQMAVPGQDEIVGLSQQVQTLQTELHGTELQNQLLRTRVAEMESHVGILMSYMLGMEERLIVLKKRLPGLPPGPQQVEFCIDHILDATPVACAPYHLALSEMKELSEQLPELSEKGFIRPSSSPRGAPKNKLDMWGDDEEEAFQTLKLKLCSVPILSLPKGRKGNVVADALSRKDKEPMRVRALVVTVHNNLPEQIRNAQVETCKEENIGAERLVGEREPFEVRSDGIKYLKGRRSLQKSLGTNLDMSTAYHPQTDGQSERTIQTLKDMLRACGIDFGSGWDKHLPLAEFSYNNSYHASIKAAPFEALYGRKCRSPVCWSEVGDAQLTGPEMIHETT
uniref:Reverse transcriptase domain-containing protein n=1 Tax=Tanacetum cinerariifolium TaxID=118510 RepID=A0A699GHF1_TANCI|nr:reverse transcriptase domain-containing protein [Tanacetum cinerariifolium]